MSVPKCYRPGPNTPKLSNLQERELLKMHATDEYSISDLGKLFKVSRPTVYRTIRRGS